MLVGERHDETVEAAAGKLFAQSLEAIGIRRHAPVDRPFNPWVKVTAPPARHAIIDQDDLQAASPIPTET